MRAFTKLIPILVKATCMLLHVEGIIIVKNFQVKTFYQVNMSGCCENSGFKRTVDSGQWV